MNINADIIVGFQVGMYAGIFLGICISFVLVLIYSGKREIDKEAKKLADIVRHETEKK